MTSSGSASSEDSANTFNILVATDNHLGYMERDPVRGNDSLVTFEEILQLATDLKVDMILLGGDLFHDNKPSRKVLFCIMELLRKYCMGDKPCPIEFLSDSRVNFPSNKFGVVNYEDPNLNISTPVFSIHGNHDDPTGDGNLCSLDLLSVCGLLNYFGKAREVDDITVTPLLLRKGTSRLALYGLGNVRDERLHRTFRSKKVTMVRPEEAQDDWFNLMVLHQNRVKHGPTNYIPETFLDDFIDLVVWGHEHECLIDPEYCEQQQFYISQPGSSIATALSEGESKPKHVGLLKIRGRDFSMKKIRLKTVRPFVMSDLVLGDVPNLSKTSPEDMMALLTAKVETMIDQATEQWRDENREELERDDTSEMPKPLVRLRVEYTGFQLCNVQRFGQQFVNRVANPKDLLLFHRRKVTEKKEAKPGLVLTDEDMMPDQLDLRGVEDLVAELLKNQTLEIFPEKMLTEAVREFVEKEEKDAIKDFIQKSLEETRGAISKRVKEAVDEEIVREVEMEKQLRSESFEKQRSKLGDDGLPEASMTKPSTSTKKEEGDDEDIDDDEQPVVRRPQKKGASPMEISEDSDVEDKGKASTKSEEAKAHLAKFRLLAPSTNGKGKEKEKEKEKVKAKPAGQGGKTKAKGRDKNDDSFDSNDDDLEETPTSTSKAKSTRGRGSSTASAAGRGRGGKGVAAPQRTLDSLIQTRKKTTQNQSFNDLSAADETATFKRKMETEGSETVDMAKKPRVEKFSFLSGETFVSEYSNK